MRAGSRPARRGLPWRLLWASLFILGMLLANQDTELTQNHSGIVPYTVLWFTHIKGVLIYHNTTDILVIRAARDSVRSR